MKSSNCHPCKRRSSQEATLAEEDLAVEAGDSLVVAVEAASVVMAEAEAEAEAAEGFLGGEAAATDLTGGIRSYCSLLMDISENYVVFDVVLRKRGRE